MSKKKGKIIKKKPSLKGKTQEFVGPGGDDAFLWGDIDGKEDEEWAKKVRELTGMDKGEKPDDKKA